MTLYKFNEKTQIDEFGVDHSNFSLRDELEYNLYRAKEKENQQCLKRNTYVPQKDTPWYRKTYDRVYAEANKLKDEPLYDKYKHSVVSCIGAQDGLYGAAVTGAMGIGKEIKDIGRKIPRQWSGKQDYGGYLSILGDSLNDLAADAKGIYMGYRNQTDNCYDMMKPYYNPKKGF